MGSHFMQAFPRAFLQKSFFSRKREAFLASFLVNPLLASSESLRSESPSLRLSENSSIDTRNSSSSAGGFETFPKRWYNFIVPTRRNGLSHAGGFETCSRSLCRLLFPFVEMAWRPLAGLASNSLVGTKPFQEKKDKQGKL